MTATAAETTVDVVLDSLASIVGMAENTFRLVTKLIMILDRMTAWIRYVTDGTVSAVAIVYRFIIYLTVSRSDGIIDQGSKRI